MVALGCPHRRCRAWDRSSGRGVCRAARVSVGGAPGTRRRGNQRPRSGGNNNICARYPSRVGASRLRDFRGSGQRVGAYLIRHLVVVRVQKCPTTLSTSSLRMSRALARDRGLDRLDRSSADGFIEAGGTNIGQLFVQKRGFFVRLIVQHAKNARFFQLAAACSPPASEKCPDGIAPRGLRPRRTRGCSLQQGSSERVDGLS